ncbi:MAG: tRNA guanosine(34) transglycosylase Tgt [Bacteroidota bacterium]
MEFSIEALDKESSARAGTIQTQRGKIETPIFMPVGTVATVKGVDQKIIEEDIKAQIILGNNYHLYLRPGLDIMQAAGGLHKFMNWDKPILTDSGGYQVYSLSGTRKIKEEGVTFNSHIDGSKHFFSPESATESQIKIGADFIMAFDECTPYPCEKNYARKSMHMTHRWLKRCIEYFDQQEPLYGFEQTFLPIVQGSVYKDLRKESAEFIEAQDQKANAIGGLSVGEPHEMMYEMTEVVCSILSKDKPRYLMGVGTPANLLECIALGIDMFDCVLPSRNARHGLLYTNHGIMNIKNKKWEKDFTPIDDIGCSMSQKYTKAYLRHLFSVKEQLGMQIATVNNLSFYLNLMKQARQQIKAGTFYEWKNKKVKQWSERL